MTTEVPDTWITENGYLYLIHRSYVHRSTLAERANRKLAECAYSHRFTASTLVAAGSWLWVDPAHVVEEQWPTSAVKDTARPGWVRVLCVDLEDTSSDSGVSGVSDGQEN